MRKLLVSISLVVLVCVSSVSARGLFVTTEENPNFVDANGDGICDNYMEGSHRHLFIDEDGDGICDNVGRQKNENVKHHHGKRNSTMNKGRNK